MTQRYYHRKPLRIDVGKFLGQLDMSCYRDYRPQKRPEELYEPPHAESFEEETDRFLAEALKAVR